LKRASFFTLVHRLEFDQQSKIDLAYNAGVEDIADGWMPYGPPEPRRAQT